MKPNADIRCRVASCRFHCEGQDYCSLEAIQIEPCQGCCSGKDSEESCCGSYKRK